MVEQRIHILDKQVAERIAAGEVVERPASVVKELVENSIDAGATAISIEIREGGTAWIRVSDNGSGMSREDARLAVERFATSKIASEQDLNAIRTLGFRGEALPSIASMSQLEILTRTKDEIEGTRVRVADGSVQTEVAGAPIGTRVIVRNLFYNAPARRKFLKAPLRETELIQKTVTSYALALPAVAFRFAVDGREILNLPKVPSGLERIAAVWGREVAAEMLEINYTSMDLSVRGFISRPTLARSSREWQNFYVNGRPIRSGLLAVMLERPFLGRIPPNRHPMALIKIDADPQLVDVNVHPRKSEVRFYQERAIYGAVAQAAEQAVRGLPAAWPNSTEWPFAGVPEPASASPPAVQEARGEYRPSNWRAVAQIHNTFILAQSHDGMVIVDQHAAQEQVYYELLTTAAGGPSQTEPGQSAGGGQLQLTPREAELLGEHLDEYRALGIALEPFGENTFRIHALPEFVQIEPREFVSAIIDEHARHRTLEGDALRDKLAAKAACLSAVKAGDALPPEKQQALLDQLAQAFAPSTCPHGRPVFVVLRLEELERRFLRR